MNDIDKYINDIDFETFKEGDEYYVGYSSNRCARYKAKIGSFRRGVAIAHLINPPREYSDVLVNVRCEIVYCPHGVRCIYEEITRQLGGTYLVKGIKDISAPGKDWYWVDNEYVIDEGYFTDSVYDYPMSIPYERGKIIKYGNTFYDLESYDVICGGPEESFFYIDSELIGGKCDVHDTRFFKKLIIEVNNGAIVKWTDVTETVDYDKTKAIFTEKMTKLSDYYLNCKTPPDHSMYGMWEVCKLLASDTPPQKVTDYTAFSKWFFAANALHQVLHNAYIEYKPNFGYMSGFNASYIDNKYVVIGRHLYNFNGEYLTTLPYAYNKRYGKYFVSNEGVFTIEDNLNIEIFPFSKIDKKNSFGAYNLCLIDRGEGSTYKDVIFYKKNLCQRKKGAFPYPDEHTEYFDIELHPLKIKIIREGLVYKEIIKNYLYKFNDGTDYPFRTFQNGIQPYREGDYVCIVAPSLVESCLNELSKLIVKGSNSVDAISPYIYDGNKNIDVERKYCDSTLWYVNYQPKGVLYSTGYIAYDHDPNDVVL